MAVSRAMRRLLRIRDIEEEQSKLALESALGELHQLEHALVVSNEMGRRGRNLVISGACSGEMTDRLAGIEEMHTSERRIDALEPMIANSKSGVDELRQEFLIKRVERKQAETLIQEAEARDALDADRRSQQSLDDWFRNRMHREEVKEDTERTESLARTLLPASHPQATIASSKSPSESTDSLKT